MTNRLMIAILITICLGGMTISSASATGYSGFETAQEEPDYTTITTQYPHPNEDSQAVQVTVTVEHTGDSELTDIVVNVRSTQRAFVAFDSFRFAKQTQSTVNVTRVRAGEVHIEPRMQPGDSVNITFNAYPKTIRTERLGVASVRTRYVQNGQQLEESDTARADLSDSPYFELREAERTIQSLRTQIQGMWAIVGVGIVLGVGGIGAAGWFYRSRSEKVNEARRGFVRDLEDLSQDVTDLQAEEKVSNLADQYRNKLGRTGVPTEEHGPTLDDDDGGSGGDDIDDLDLED